MSGHGEGIAVVIGGGGGIGSACAVVCESNGSYSRVFRYGRNTGLRLDLLEEASIENAARDVASYGPLRLLLIASGFLHNERFSPEKSLKQVDADHMKQAFTINAIGPALVLKHFLPLAPREGRCVIAALSARVGSIADNELGGWISYRASKAALNQIIRTAALELRRTRPEAICVAIHPGTVDTALSAPFAKAGLNVRLPAQAAVEIIGVLDKLGPEQNGSFIDYRGAELPW